MTICSLLWKITNVLTKNHFTLITARKKQQGLLDFQLGMIEGLLPRRWAHRQHPSLKGTGEAQRQPRVTHQVTLAAQLRYVQDRPEQERKQQWCCSALGNPNPSAQESGRARCFLETGAQAMFPRWLCHPQSRDDVAWAAEEEWESSWQGKPLCLPTSQDEEAFRKIWEEESNRSPVVSSNSSTWTQV